MSRRPSPSRVASRYAFMPGVRDPNGWEPGKVEPGDEHDAEGSELPPTKTAAMRRTAGKVRFIRLNGRWFDLDEHDAEGSELPSMKTAAMRRTAGEVRFIKDRSGDKGEWAFGPPGPSERQIQQGFVFNPKHLKPLAQTLRSALMALGHCTSAYNRFVKIKSRNVSPDGNLGGRGYIQKIPDMRRQLMNCVEALSALTDTIYDEMNAPHWNPTEDTLDARDRDEVKEIIEDVEEIKDDPEGWAEEQEEDMDEDNGMGKTARLHRTSRRHTRRLA